jgi:hypothetical protein
LKTKGILFVVLLFLMVTILPLNVSQAGTTWTYETVTQTGIGGAVPECSLALDSAGNPHISYSDETNHYLKYATSKKVLTVERALGSLRIS